MKIWRIMTAIAILTAAAPAAGQNAAMQTVGESAPPVIAGWTVGALAFGGGEAVVAAPTSMHDKLRAGPGLALKSLGDRATLRPWTAGPSAAGNAGGAGGVLLDVPMGGFTFTPSFGAARSEAVAFNGGAATITLRSQLEIGYQFDNTSRLSFGYSRISAYGGEKANQDRGNGDMLTLSYRLPFGALLD